MRARREIPPPKNQEHEARKRGLNQARIERQINRESKLTSVAAIRTGSSGG